MAFPVRDRDALDHRLVVDPVRFDVASLTEFTAPKGMNYGTEAVGRILAKCGANCIDHQADHCPAIGTQFRREARKQVAGDPRYRKSI